jgi:hypothetical protein
MLDSNRADVQDVAIDLARKSAGLLNLPALAARLVEHPHRHVRQFALDMVTAHWPAGAASLAGLERFCRTILLDTWPSRREKSGLIGFLLDRGLEGEAQAVVAARVLGEAMSVATRVDFELALAATTRLSLAFPDASAREMESANGGGA